MRYEVDALMLGYTMFFLVICISGRGCVEGTYLYGVFIFNSGFKDNLK